MRYYQEALAHCEKDLGVHLSLAELYLTKGELEQCEEECTTILREDSSHQGACMVRRSDPNGFFDVFDVVHVHVYATLVVKTTIFIVLSMTSLSVYGEVGSV